MELKKLLWRILPVTALIGAAPLLMAPATPTCDACIEIQTWNGSLNANQSATKNGSCQKGKVYHASLWSSHSSTLGVIGDLSNLTCQTVEGIRTCAFSVNNTSTVQMKVTAGSQAIDYELTFAVEP